MKRIDRMVRPLRKLVDDPRLAAHFHAGGHHGIVKQLPVHHLRTGVSQEQPARLYFLIPPTFIRL